MNNRYHKNLSTQFLFLLFTGAYALITVLTFWNKPVVIIFFLIAGILLQLLFWNKNTDLIIMILAAILGTLSEILCVKTGIWTYNAPNLFFGIPLWIPLVWAYLFNFFRRLSKWILLALQKTFPEKNSLISKIIFGFLGGSIIIYFVITIIVINKIIGLIYFIFMLIAVIFFRNK